MSQSHLTDLVISDDDNPEWKAMVKQLSQSHLTDLVISDGTSLKSPI